MSKFLKFFVSMSRCPPAVFTLLGLFAFCALAAALISEIVFGLEPCRLCIYQRWPFLIIIFLSLLGIMRSRKPKSVGVLYALCGTAFFTNALIAFYHTGVEQKWWISQVEGCVIPQFSAKDESWIDNIMSAPSKPCDEIAWADPLFGLTMANYNVIAGLVFAAYCVFALFLMRSNNTVKQDDLPDIHPDIKA